MPIDQFDLFLEILIYKMGTAHLEACRNLFFYLKFKEVRKLLGAAVNAASSTFLSDLGLISIKGELAKKILSLRERLELMEILSLGCY